MNLEIAINCYKYQHRMCWMLSSILQQKGAVPDILVNVSYTENDGNPITEEVCNYFKNKGLNIKETVMSEADIQNRSHARKKQSLESESDWMLFADADMVYDPYFFDDLAKKIVKKPWTEETRVIGANRVSLQIDFCANYFDNDKRKYPCEISNVAKRVSKWPVFYIKGKRIAAGYFQLARTENIKKTIENFPIARRDGLRVYRADRAFRCAMGGRTGIDVLPQYHLNHSRDLSLKQR